MKYKLLVLDIDGTLTNSKKIITDNTLKALIDIQKKGVKVVIASGRPTPGVIVHAKTLNFAEYGSFILSYNGARIIDCTNEQIVYQKTLPIETIPQIYELAVKYKCGIMTYKEDCIISGSETDEYMELESRINGIPINRVSNFPEYVNFAVNKCVMTNKAEVLEEAEKAVKKKFEGVLNVYRSEPFFLETMPKDIDKANSLSRLLEYLKITPEEIICCGDGYNDISMIKYAGLGVAMANAQKEVKEAADYITLSNDEDGVVHVIDKFIRKNL